jgi:hypothetical protein
VADSLVGVYGHRCVCPFLSLSLSHTLLLPFLLSVDLFGFPMDIMVMVQVEI